MANGVNGDHASNHERDEDLENTIRSNQDKHIQELEKEVEYLHLRLLTKVCILF